MGGRILTDQSLRVVDQQTVFAAGDTADVNGENYSQIGVHAVKQGVVLRENLESLHRGEALIDYSPYLINPLILSDGPDRAFYILNRFVSKGRWAAILKYVLDMRWLEKYSKPQVKRRSYTISLQNGIMRSF
jgi:NADH dehydrogenase FAD-containing subunit